MRPYTAYVNNKTFDLDDVDCAGLTFHARKSSLGSIPGHGGECHNTVRNATSKRLSRISWKKAARAQLKRDLQNRLAE